MSKNFVAALDQGTTSTRFMIFDSSGETAGTAGKEHAQIFPRPGWVEHDPMEILANTEEVIRRALTEAGIDGGEIAALGITNQRETTVLWNKRTGKPYLNAVVWQCTRTKEICDDLAREGGTDRFRGKTGLPLATYFSGPKIKWALDNMEGLRRDAERGDALFGTMDTWILWNLTGGPQGGVHVTDVTNASRTQLMNLETLDWDEKILKALRIPRRMLPEIRPSSDPGVYGYTSREGPLGASVPLCGDLGDQQAALAGQACFSPGEGKNTYGTGCFLLVNTGDRPVPSGKGLITTVGYKFGSAPAAYALEGSIAVAGALVQWLRDNLDFFDTASEIERYASKVEDNGGVYFVPAFSGLFAPRWRSDARGIIAGLTRYADKNHICRAALEATAYQVREVLEAMRDDAGLEIPLLKADGGMVANDLLMQFQADILDIPVVRPKTAETTALGAAYAAGLAVGFWKDTAELKTIWKEEKRWEPRMDPETRNHLYAGWLKAVERTLGWVE